jgi:hypothetical protein
VFGDLGLAASRRAKKKHRRRNAYAMLCEAVGCLNMGQKPIYLLLIFRFQNDGRCTGRPLVGNGQAGFGINWNCRHWSRRASQGQRADCILASEQFSNTIGRAILAIGA